ncbi:MAG: cyclase family protein [Proteobacteria bacterium]|nr:cyclase family protein [Pseudomonadota bacterium]
MTRRWKYRPPGSNWGEFGDDDERGRMNLVTPARRLAAMAEVRTGRTFCLSMPLDRPGGQVLNGRRSAPAFHPVMRDGHVHFNLPLEFTDARLTDVSTDEAVLLYSQYSTQWDALAHKGSLFDAQGTGTPQRVFYNGHAIVDDRGQGTQGALGAQALSIARMAETCVQGRGVMIDVRHHLGDERIAVTYDVLAGILAADGVVVEEGDFVCIHTGLAQRIMDAGGGPLDPALKHACAVLDGADPRLLEWITDSGLAAIACDNLAVERSSTLGITDDSPARRPSLPLHEHCLFKLGVHLGELWYLTELAHWLRAHGRSRFLLTAPPLRLPGAAGSPVTPVATV